MPLLLFACAKHPKKANAEKKKDEKTIAQSVKFGKGDVKVYETATSKTPSYTVHWKQGGLDASKTGVDMGDLEGVSGDLLQNGKKTSEYTAERGDANRALKRLNLTKGVTLRSVDGENTLLAASAEYRHDVGLLRATGGVKASGPFGTLSGVPELWATPDLHLIGTPLMVAKTLKTPVLVALAATAATGAARFQKADAYTLSGNNGYLVDIRTPGKTLITVPPAKGQTIVITLPTRGLVFRFSATVVLEIDPKNKNEVRHMTTKGPVNVVKAAPTGKTTLDGSSATYDAAPGEDSGTLDLQGPVTIVSAAKDAKGAATTTTSRGDKGRAILLNKPKADENALKRATLDGDVTIESKGAGNDGFKGTGERLVYVPNGATADADLTGGVVLTRTTKGKDKDGKATSQTVVSRGQRAHVVIDPKASGDDNPMKNATLDGKVAIDVSGSNGQSFKGTGDRIVYTATGEGGRAVMTGALNFTGDLPDFLGGSSGTDIATVVIGKEGWETIETSNSEGRPATTTIKQKPKPATPKKGGKP